MGAAEDVEEDMGEYSWGQLPVHDESGSWGPICTDVLDGDVDDMSLSLFNIAIDSGRPATSGAVASDVPEEIMGGGGSRRRKKKKKKGKKMSPTSRQLQHLATLAKNGQISAAQKAALKSDLIRGAM